jgi:hypothetical protein
MNDLIKNKFKIFAFRAIDEPELCEQYISGHIKVLTDFKITNITSNNKTWINNPNIYCLGLINDSTNHLLGGIRIQLADGINSLPVEGAIGYLDDKIYTHIKNYAINGGVGELSGLWVDNKLKGLGMGPYLVRASIASSNQLNFKTMIGICAEYSLKMFNNVGFIIDKSLGKKGDFPYPNDNYLAHVVGILNATTLQSATKYDKEIMVSLRANVRQKRIEIDMGINVEIDYDIHYSTVVATNYIENCLKKQILKSH